MTKLSISRAWDEAAAVLKRDAATLYLIAFGLGTLPQLILGAVFPRGAPGGSILPVLLLLASLAVGIAGSIAISALALGKENVVGRGIAHGFRRMPSLFGATLLLFLVLIIVAAVVAGLAGLTPENAFAAEGQPSPKAALVVVVVSIIALLIGARFALTTPIAAAEGGGPLAILRRSWRLTGGNYGRVLLFLILLALAGLVFMLAVILVSGVIVALALGQPEPGSAAAFVGSLVVAAANGVFVLIFTVAVAKVYAQLAGNSETVHSAVPPKNGPGAGTAGE